ncbi:hypothetical protein EG328_003496 [Venturia inaequalis]|uniref:Uncharacterized protein n=1 Tax=Venturia inaequalis TaxID=5025 RepID=A0A8H3URL3_VENIN|nr:hypothetical protein EG328_003496 [Venturia inaequalis]KAE9989834.1 hypothetical protein EG327_002175 [Venturia inaequalis]RDI87625.1 hypothetical protein Vi05172_g2310 [Venturia inaequalis]
MPRRPNSPHAHSIAPSPPQLRTRDPNNPIVSLRESARWTQLNQQQPGRSDMEPHGVNQSVSNFTSSSTTGANHGLKWNRPSKLTSGHTPSTQPRSSTISPLQYAPDLDETPTPENMPDPLRRKEILTNTVDIPDRHSHAVQDRPSFRPRGPRVPSLNRRKTLHPSHLAHAERNGSRPMNHWTSADFDVELARMGFHGRRREEE